MFVVLYQKMSGWIIEHLEYHTHLNPAITAARLRWRKDQHPRRVASWPENAVLWQSDNEPRPDFAAMAREVFGPNTSQAAEVTETFKEGPDGY